MREACAAWAYKNYGWVWYWLTLIPIHRRMRILCHLHRGISTSVFVQGKRLVMSYILYPKEYFPTKVSQYEIWSYTYCENEWNGMESNFIEVYFCIVDCCWNYSTGKRMPEFRHQSKHKTAYEIPWTMSNIPNQFVETDVEKILIQKQLKQTNETCCCIRCC